MKLESITVENYRQFEKAELTFDEGITILAGANNSGKTSLINLIKNIFVDDKLNYNMSDIPAKNMREWVEWVYPIFQKFFRDRKTEENVEKDLLNVVIPKEETDSTHLMKMTTVKIHVSYNPDMDDIKLFADCIMDLDETKHDFYFMYNFEIVHTQFAREIINNFSKIKHRFAEIEEKKSQYAETTDELIINNIQVKERYLKQFWKKYSAVDVMTKDEARINDALLSFLFIVDQIIEYYLQECYGEVFRNIHEYYMYFNSEKYIVEKHRDKKTIKTRLEKIKNSYVDRATTIDGFLNICFKEEFIEEEIYYSIIEDDDYQLVKDVYIEEVRKLTNYLNDPRVSTQHGVKGESHDTVVFVADNSSNPAVHMSKFLEVWSEMNITLREFDAFYYRYSNMIKDIECTMGIKISELKAKSYAAVADMIDTVLKRFISENENNPYYIFLLKPKMEKYKKKKNVTSAKACLNEGTVYGPLCAYRLFYVGCSRARKNLLIIINREDVKNFEDKLYEKLKDCGFEVEY